MKRRGSKRGLCLFLSCVLLITAVLCGCGQEEPTGEPYEVYYLNRDETRITAETVYLEEGLSQAQEASALLEALAQEPQSATDKASVGASFQVNSVRIMEGQLTLDVSEEYHSLSATTEILIRAALVYTLTQVEDVTHVLITVDGVELTDSSGNVIGAMSADQFIYNAGNEINAYEMVTLQLYFANEAGDRLVKTRRSVVYNTNISMEKLVVEQLIEGVLGTETQEVCSVLNPETKVLSVSVKDGTCYVNLDEAFLTQTYSVTPEVVIYSITNSLVELSNINKVQIAVDGETDLVYRESFSLSTVFERNLDLVEED